jgi:hypothetical protein
MFFKKCPPRFCNVEFQNQINSNVFEITKSKARQNSCYETVPGSQDITFNDTV